MARRKESERERDSNWPHTERQQHQLDSQVTKLAGREKSITIIIIYFNNNEIDLEITKHKYYIINLINYINMLIY